MILSSSWHSQGVLMCFVTLRVAGEPTTWQLFPCSVSCLQECDGNYRESCSRARSRLSTVKLASPTQLHQGKIHLVNQSVNQWAADVWRKQDPHLRQQALYSTPHQPRQNKSNADALTSVLSQDSFVYIFMNVKPGKNMKLPSLKPTRVNGFNTMALLNSQIWLDSQLICYIFLQDVICLTFLERVSALCNSPM